MPGFGRSPPLPDGTPPTPQALAAAVAGFLDAIGLRQVHLAGNSLGGWVALELAKAGPRAVGVGALLRGVLEAAARSARRAAISAGPGGCCCRR